MGISIAQGEDHWYIPVGHRPVLGMPQENIPFVPDDIFEPIKNHTIVMHNAKFDLHVLRSIGIKTRYPNLFDSMLMSHFIDENVFDHKLETLAKKYSTVKKNMELQKILKQDWDNAFIPGMDKYAEEDAQASLQVFHALDRQFGPYREAWEVDREFLYCLLDIEAKGVRLDTERCEHHEILCRKRMKEIRDELGFDLTKDAVLHPKLFSDPPLGYGLKPLSHTPKKGKPQVNAYFLENTNHPVCGLITEYRHNQKMASSYFRNYLDIVGGVGRLHPTFKMHGTKTGRLSCEYPNLQQIPRDSDVKKMFLPDEGMELWELDFRNLELRTAAVYSQQPKLLEAFRSEADIHQQVADSLGITRQTAKIVNFLVFYLGGVEELSKKAGISLQAARRTIDKTKKEYPEVFATAAQCERIADAEGQIRLMSGRIRHFKFPSEHRKAWNSVIQGGSFEIVKRSMLRLEKAGFDQRLTVHDSVWLNQANEKEVIEAEKEMSEWTRNEFQLHFAVDRKLLRSGKDNTTGPKLVPIAA